MYMWVLTCAGLLVCPVFTLNLISRVYFCLVGMSESRFFSSTLPPPLFVLPLLPSCSSNSAYGGFLGCFVGFLIFFAFSRYFHFRVFAFFSVINVHFYVLLHTQVLYCCLWSPLGASNFYFLWWFISVCLYAFCVVLFCPISICASWWRILFGLLLFLVISRPRSSRFHARLFLLLICLFRPLLCQLPLVWLPSFLPFLAGRSASCPVFFCYAGMESFFSFCSFPSYVPCLLSSLLASALLYSF